ncbi:MAG: hypothetical protein U9R50_12410 [Campylobacterota bacterium]|nr:hypothetical protein [Campylobacterota bacterium]
MKRVIIALLMSSALFGALFEKGSKNVGVAMSAGSFAGNNYTILGINASYFIADNVMTGFEYRGWLGNDPSVNEVSVPVTYMVPLHKKFYPYVGGFYRRTFMGSGWDDYNVYGARAGVSMVTSGNSYASFGWVQEYYDGDGDSSNGYPEIAVGMSF